MVFDKGVESIHFVYYHYLQELTQFLGSILEKREKKYSNDTIQERRYFQIFEEKYKFMCERLRNELDIALGYLNNEKMSYNDVRFTKIATHIMFIQSLSKFANESNKLEFENVLEKVKKYDRQINCFIKLYFDK